MGATCNNLPSTVLPATSQHHLHPLPSEQPLEQGGPQPTLLQLIPPGAVVTIRAPSPAWSWEPSPCSAYFLVLPLCLLEPENKPHSPLRLQIVEGCCPNFSSLAKCPELQHLTI